MTDSQCNPLHSTYDAKSGGNGTAPAAAAVAPGAVPTDAAGVLASDGAAVVVVVVVAAVGGAGAGLGGITALGISNVTGSAWCVGRHIKLRTSQVPQRPPYLIFYSFNAFAVALRTFDVGPVRQSRPPSGSGVASQKVNARNTLPHNPHTGKNDTKMAAVLLCWLQSHPSCLSCLCPDHDNDCTRGAARHTATLLPPTHAARDHTVSADASGAPDCTA